MDVPADTLQISAIDRPIVARAAQVLKAAAERGLTLVTAESCTGGLLAAVLSDAPGAAEQLQGGFVVYTKANKEAALGIPPDLLARESAVSEPVARAMAEGALAHSPAEVALAVTGVAGPDCDEDGNPVGLVHFAVARRGARTHHKVHRFGDIGRGAVRYWAVFEALDLLEQAIKT